MVRLEMELEQTKYLIGALLELNNTPGPDIDAGKWYRRNMD